MKFLLALLLATALRAEQPYCTPGNQHYVRHGTIENVLNTHVIPIVVTRARLEEIADMAGIELPAGYKVAYFFEPEYQHLIYAEDTSPTQPLSVLSDDYDLAVAIARLDPLDRIDIDPAILTDPGERYISIDLL